MAQIACAEHLPQRPAWTCAACGEAWPCKPKRTELTQEFAEARISLLLYLAACLSDASADVPVAEVGDLYDRFLGWATR